MFDIQFLLDGKPFEPENLVEEVIKSDKNRITRKVNAALTADEIAKLKFDYVMEHGVGLVLKIAGPQELTEKARKAILGP